MRSLWLRVIRIITEVTDTIKSPQKLRLVFANSLYRNAFHLMLNNTITSVLGFLFWIVVARFYSETEVGFGSAIISAIHFLALLSLVGLNFSIIRFLPQANQPRDLINSGFTVSGLMSLMLSIIFVAGIPYWSPALNFIRQNSIFTLAFLVITVCSTMSSVLDSIFIAKRRAVFVLSFNAIVSFMKLPLVVALGFFFHTFGVVAAWGIAIGVALIISIFVFLPVVEQGYKPLVNLGLSQVKNMWQYSAGSYVASLLALAPLPVLPLMVVNVLGAEENAYFYIAWALSGLLFAIPWSVSNSLFAESSHSREVIKQDVIKSFQFTYLVLIPAIIVMLILAKWLLLAFGQTYSANALKLFWLLSLSSLPLVVNSIYTTLLRVSDKMKELVIIRGLHTTLVLVLCFLSLKSFGIIGIGYTWLGVQTAFSIVLAIRSRALIDSVSQANRIQL